MNETIIISAIVGSLTGVISAYITTILKIRADKEKWLQEFRLKYAVLKVIPNRYHVY